MFRTFLLRVSNLEFKKRFRWPQAQQFQSVTGLKMLVGRKAEKRSEEVISSSVFDGVE